MAFRLPRPPRDDEELWWVIKAMFGVELPRVKVCADHVSPFDAVAHAYFGREPNFAVWYASRGSGKSLALAVLGLTKAFVRDIDVTILGGSMTQSLNVREHMRKLMAHPNSPTYSVDKDQATLIQMSTGKAIKPLPASQTTVRGPHPPLQLLDEVDEMELAIYNASLGQAMEQKNAHGETIEEYIVASSTWQNPEGCVQVGTLVLTARGSIPVEQVVAGDQVMTRTGWRRVLASLDMGVQETLEVVFASGRRLTCTPWHPVWGDDVGWTRADALTPGTAACAVEARPVGVGLDGDRLEVAGVDAGAVRTGVAAVAGGVLVVADVVDLPAPGDRAPGHLPDPAVRGAGLAARGGGVTTLQPVAVLHDVERPRDAVVGVEVDGHAFLDDQVHHVSPFTTRRATWDLTVEDCHEYVAGGILVHNTFTTVMEDAREKGMPIFTWCWRELIKTPENPSGWMSQRFIDNKRKAVSAQMWHTEYELNEPNAGSRALDLDKVEQFFVEYPPTLRETHQGNGDHDVYVWEDPTNGMYAVGADWAKEQDKTVIAVMRYDVTPHRIVKLIRINRRPWDFMIGLFNAEVSRYQAVGEHDGTGVGNVVHDYLDSSTSTNKFVMIGRKRTELLLNYITAFEHGKYRLPLIPKDESFPGVTVNPLYRAHRAVTVADVYAPGKWNTHLPDDFAALALAHRAISVGGIPAAAQGVSKDGSVREVDKPFHVKPSGETVQVIGEATVVDERYSGSDGLSSVGAGGDFWSASEI